MQKTETNNGNIIEAQQHNSPITESNHSLITSATTRTQNFSFASNYQPSIGQFIGSPKADITPSAQKFSILSKSILNLSKPIAAFSVLQNEDYYASNSSLSVSKPNAIVRPIRRYDKSSSALPGNYDIQQEQQQQQHGAQQTENENMHTSHSQSIQYQPSGASITQTRSLAHHHYAPTYAHNHHNHPHHHQHHHFAEELKRKLHYLHYRNSPTISMSNWPGSEQHEQNSIHDVGKRRAKGKDSTNSLGLYRRPLFITTVPTGVFLPPPKEIPLPLFLRPYVYSSHPVVLSDSSASSNYNKSPTFTKDKHRSFTAPIAMSDKNFMPTKTTTTTTMMAAAVPNSNSNLISKSISMSSSSSSHFNGNIRHSAQSVAGGLHLTKEQFQQQLQQHRGKREIAREPFGNLMHDRRVVRGSNFGMHRRQPKYEICEPPIREERVRQIPRYRLNTERYKRNTSSTRNQPSKRDEVIQTDEELFSPTKTKDCTEFSVNTQTEMLPYPNEMLEGPNKNRVDVSTEIREQDLILQHEEETQSLIDFYVNVCFEQAVLEMAHEVEMEDLRQKYKALQKQLEIESNDVRNLDNSMAIQKSNQEDTTAAKLLQGHIAKMVPEVLENLESSAYIEPDKKNEVMKSICPWLTVEVAEEVGHIVDSREILTVIIEEIIKQRAANYGDVKSMPEIVANIEEIEVPTEDSKE